MTIVRVAPSKRVSHGGHWSQARPIPFKPIHLSANRLPANLLPVSVPFLLQLQVGKPCDFLAVQFLTYHIRPQEPSSQLGAESWAQFTCLANKRRCIIDTENVTFPWVCLNSGSFPQLFDFSPLWPLPVSFHLSFHPSISFSLYVWLFSFIFLIITLPWREGCNARSGRKWLLIQFISSTPIPRHYTHTHTLELKVTVLFPSPVPQTLMPWGTLGSPLIPVADWKPTG